ncbi:MAG TPA: hypothetical protein VFF76_04900 [Holophagaceae bacterium]|jgi:hypothetical protein|nr:hypothetical protein [Holophagaceae bacterium]
MDRFGSSKLRIGWTLAFLFLAGLVFMAVKGQAGDSGSSLVVMGTPVPLGMDTLESYVTGNLRALIYACVPLVVLLGSFAPLAPMAGAGARSERYLGLTGGVFFAFLHGLFLSQVMLLPVWAATWRLTGHMFPGELLKADGLALLLGLQLLLWSMILMRLLRSNPGLGLLLALLLREVGSRLQYFADFGQDLGLSAGQSGAIATLHKLLPSGQLPTDPFSTGGLLLSIGGPLLLGFLVLFPDPKSGAKRPSAKKAKV